MYNLGQKMLAEFIGAFALLLVTVGSNCAGQQAGANGPGVLGLALAPGLAIAAMFAAVGHISGGHFNPAVTAALWVTRRHGTFEAVLYWIAQLLGAAAGCYFISLFFLTDVWRGAHLGVPALASEVSPVIGMLIEAGVTFLLVFVYFGTVVDKECRYGKVAPLALGFTITGNVLVGGGLTGAAMNPARAFGPALVGHYWANQPVYWVGPLAGGIAAGSLYSLLLIRKSSS
jgi:aquaporin Z